MSVHETFKFSINIFILDDLVDEEEKLIKEKKKAVERQPTGRIVGIIRRKWRQYCGILQNNPVKGVRNYLLLNSSSILIVLINTLIQYDNTLGYF